MKIYTSFLIFFFSIYTLDAQTRINFTDSCFTSGAIGTSFNNTSQLTNNNADLMSWAPGTTSWTGSWPNANLHTPPPDSLANCRGIFCGNGSTWTTGGEGFGIKMTAPLVSGQTYSFGMTYVSDGFGSTGSFAPFVYTSNSTAVPSGTLVGSLPPAGYTWLTSTFTFTATPAQNGDTWLILFTGSSGSSGIVNSLCPDCQTSTGCSLHVNLGPDTTICSGQSLTLNAGAITGATYLWQDGSTASTLSVTTPGTYWVHVTSGACTAGDTIVVNTTPLPVVNLGNDTTVCFPNTVILTAGVAGPTYHWQDGSTSNTYTVSTSGSYSVTVTSLGCSSADSVTVTVVPLPSVSVADTAVCVNQQVVLTATPSSPGGTYLWSPGGATTQSITINATSTSTYTVTFSTASCGSAVDSGTITIVAAPTVSVNDTTICSGRNATLTATPTLAGGTYSWAPGGASTQSITVSPTSDVTYTVTYSTLNCGSAVDSGVITVTPAPLVSVNDTSVCSGQSATLTAIPSIAGGSYSWSPGGGSSQSITVSPSATSTYTLTYSIAGCGTAVDSGIVTITPAPTLSIGADTTICPGGTAILTASSSMAGGTYSWTPVTASTSSVSVSPATQTTYYVTYNIPGCALASDSETVTLYPAISVNLTPEAPSCPTTSDGVITSSVLPAGTYSYLWSDNNTTANDSNLSAGTYRMTVTDQNGCTASNSAVIIPPTPASLAIYPADTTVMQGSIITLNSVFGGYPSSAITSYTWIPATGLSCYTCANPIDSTGPYTDTLSTYVLIVTYNSGCIVSDSVTIHMELLGISAIPDAFSPNGDGKNDTFMILTKAVSSARLSIYNRWGEQVYTSTDINQGWDGTYKGVPQPTGVYTLFYTVVYLDGKTESRTGSVTLLR